MNWRIGYTNWKYTIDWLESRQEANIADWIIYEKWRTK